MKDGPSALKNTTFGIYTFLIFCQCVTPNSVLPSLQFETEVQLFHINLVPGNQILSVLSPGNKLNLGRSKLALTKFRNSLPSA